MGAPVTPLWAAGTSIMIEQPDSGQYTLNRVWRRTDRYRGTYDVAASAIPHRGTVGDGGTYFGIVYPAFFVVAEARLRKLKPTAGEIEIDWETTNVLPPDEFYLEPEPQNPRIERSPLFAALLPADLARVQRAFLASSTGQLNTALDGFVTTSNAALATLLYSKLRQGLETYYLSLWGYRWVSYYTASFPPIPFLGGVRQNPGGPLAGILSGNWLREADTLENSGQSPLGTILKLTRTWRGGPNGWWDADLYANG